MELPAALKEALEREAVATPASLAQSAQDLSLRYRQREAQGGSFLTGGRDAAAYAASRLPATYGAALAALRHGAACLPGFEPRTMLDAGCGPGTALWAAAQLWPGMLAMTALERDADMRTLAARLATHGPTPALRQADILPADLRGPWEAPHSDLVTACYVINELDSAGADTLTRRLWEHTKGALLIVEPGTKAGFATVLRCRDVLRELGATIAAPCPHADICPLAEDWCHFSQRVARSRTHRTVKGAALGYEDEKYSYVCATRQTAAPAIRVLRHPQVRKGHIHLSLCTPEGLKEVTLSKKDSDAYRRARDLKWGDAF